MAGTITTDIVEAKYKPIATGFQGDLAKLQGRPLTQQTRSLAVEIDTKAQRFLGELELQRIELKKPILEAGRKLDAFFKRIADPAFAARDGARKLIASIDSAEREKRLLEALERAKAERERLMAEKQREVDEMIAHAAASNDAALLEAAEQLEAEPVMATVVKPDEYTPADTGYSTSQVPVGRIVTLRNLLLWLLAEPARLEAMPDLIEVKQGRLNAYLRKGVKFPADVVEVGYEDRSINRGQAE